MKSRELLGVPSFASSGVKSFTMLNCFRISFRHQDVAVTIARTLRLGHEASVLGVLALDHGCNLGVASAHAVRSFLHRDSRLCASQVEEALDIQIVCGQDELKQHLHRSWGNRGPLCD